MKDAKGPVTVVLVGALDTKGEDFRFVRDLLAAEGLRTVLVDFGVLCEPSVPPDVSSADVALAGGSRIDLLRAAKDKAEAMRVMASGAVAIVRNLYEAGRLQGILGMGGTGGTAIASACMRSLPIGVPKVLVSTAGSADMSGYVGAKDITIIPSIVDVAGINRISRLIYSNAAGAIAGMVRQPVPQGSSDLPLVAASMFGNTTPCIERAKTTLEANAYEVLVFHATGAGGKAMLSLAGDGLLAGILDLTTTELADEVCGGVFSAGRARISMGAAHAPPVVLAPGCVDMCNFWARDTVPEKYRNRLLYEWNPNVTLMRTNIAENARIGEMIADTANSCSGKVTILLPMKGVSMLDSKDGAFWDEAADAACYDAIRRTARRGIPIVEVDANINDPEFADRAAGELLSMLEHLKQRSHSGFF